MIQINTKLPAIKNAVFSFRGRLLDRQVYRYLFEGADKESVISAVLAYQNRDGGFGNGIEPDILVPESTAIGLETALSCFEIIDYIPSDTANGIVGWINGNLNAAGLIPHPPKSIDQYPHQSWWKNEDKSRIYSIIGLLHKLGVPIPDDIGLSVLRNATLFPLPQDLKEYDYPIYVYAFYVKEYPKRKEVLDDFTVRFPDAIRNVPIRFLAFTRYWKILSPLLDSSLLLSEAKRFLDTINESGLIPTGYPDLPWWDSIMILDCLTALRQLKLM
jgi:hypothetical protein